MIIVLANVAGTGDHFVKLPTMGYPPSFDLPTDDDCDRLPPLQKSERILGRYRFRSG
jgi:hypothetical protein